MKEFISHSRDKLLDEEDDALLDEQRTSPTIAMRTAAHVCVQIYR